MAGLRIAIVGGGVTGLSCALVLAERHHVTILAERIGVLSDSIKATAIWHVYLVPETELILSWAQRSLERFVDLSRREPQAGVELVEGVELFRKGSPELPSWCHIPPVFRMLSDEEVASYNRFDERAAYLPAKERAALEDNPVKWGYVVQAPAADMRIYLAWLENSCRYAGVQFIKATVEQFSAIEGAYDVIVNCSGFGARELANDANFVPYKGQYFVLKSGGSSPSNYIGDDDHPGGMAYVIPRLGEVMVGGCAEEGVEDLELTLDWEETFRRAGLYVPWLRTRNLDDQARPAVVGVRPCRRSGVRLEADTTAARIPVIHNYGHGGSGFSLSWGCADAVAKLVLGVTGST